MKIVQHLYNVSEEGEVVPIIEYEEGDDLIHTPENPFCNEEGCPCGGVRVDEEEDEEVTP